MRSADGCERGIFGCAPQSSKIDINDLPSHTAKEKQRVLKIIVAVLLGDQRAWQLDAASAIWREVRSTMRDRL